MKRIASALLRLFSSYGLACAILLLLCLLVFLGTIEQVRLGLFEAQKRYFSSLLVVFPVPLGSGRYFPLPLPGVMLLLMIFSVNIILGGLLRLRVKPSYIGLFIVHGGILFLLFGGLVTWAVGYGGQMTLADGETSSRFQSYTDWEVAIVDTSPKDRNIEYTVPQKELLGLKDDKTYTFRSPSLPFDVVLSQYSRNADVMPKGPMFDAPTPVVDGKFVDPLPLDKEAEANLPAVYASIRDKKTGQENQTILWGNWLTPSTLRVGGAEYEFFLRHTTWDLPFAIRLTHFTREFYPRTTEPKDFESAIVKIDKGREQNVVIRMNEPMRTEGYVFYQASYVEDPKTHALSSTFAVTNNPADKFPLIACVIITFGMFVHFITRLTRFLRREREQTA